jgi:hypothetical protein
MNQNECMVPRHKGTLTDESIDKMKASGLWSMPHLKCKDCGATVTGILDYNKRPIPMDHIPSKSGKRRNTKS